MKQVAKYGKAVWQNSVRPVFPHCVICGALLPRRFSQSRGTVREASQCVECGGTWRARAVTLALISSLGYSPKPLSRIRADWSRVGVGVSDDFVIAGRFGQVWTYTNTFYDDFPHLDVRDVPSRLFERNEFIVCSDVLEHVDPPLEDALLGLRRMLKPNGFVVISVPMNGTAESDEYYPGLVDWELVWKQGSPELHWRDSFGTKHVDSSPEMHGGRGQTIAFRSFGHRSLSDLFTAAGFSRCLPLQERPDLAVPPIADSGVVVAWH